MFYVAATVANRFCDPATALAHGGCWRMEASERSQNVPSSQTSYGITIIKECGGHALLVRGQRAVRPLIFHWAIDWDWAIELQYTWLWLTTGISYVISCFLGSLSVDLTLFFHKAILYAVYSMIATAFTIAGWVCFLLTRLLNSVGRLLWINVPCTNVYSTSTRSVSGRNCLRYVLLIRLSSLSLLANYELILAHLEQLSRTWLELLHRDLLIIQNNLLSISQGTARSS